MKDKTFKRLLALITAIGILTTVSLTVYTVYLYKHASITSFIANESR
ncbi:MAG: hypothetical protein Q4F95_01340 [Oscillospiraceae bacterium]|nr:hypothetical protein [Oscillospiraceae bacterium]